MDGVEEVALYLGDIENGTDVPVRVHSECLTGEVFGSLRCDCRTQLELAMARVGEVGRGAIVYLRQEGRGIGLGNKIAAYALQDEGRDTVDANKDLGFEIDLRSYERAASILNDLGVQSVRLMTNNPEKVNGLKSAGVLVSSRWEHWGQVTEENRGYLETKRDKLGHLLSGAFERAPNRKVG